MTNFKRMIISKLSSVVPLLLFISFSSFGQGGVISAAQMEFDSLKQVGNMLFKAGEYRTAKFKYLACLEVPGYATDDYVSNRAKVCDQALNLISDAKAALLKDNLDEGIKNYEELLKYINEEDEIIKEEVGRLWFLHGEGHFINKKYQEAKDDYLKSIRYFSLGEIEARIRECEELIEQLKLELGKPKLPFKSYLPEIAVGSVGLISFISGLNYNQNWNSIQNDIETARSGNNLAQYELNYSKAEDYYKNIKKRNIYFGVAMTSILMDGLLLLRKNTSRKKVEKVKLSFKTPSQLKLAYNLN